MTLFSGFCETGGLRSVSLSVPNLVFVMGSFGFLLFLFYCCLFISLLQIMMVTQYVHAANNSLDVSSVCIREKTQQQPSCSWIKELIVSL